MKYSHGNTPYGYKPCTREAGHEGPCALDMAESFACPDCTDYGMAYGRGGWYRTNWLWGKVWIECDTCGGAGVVYDEHG